MQLPEGREKAELDEAISMLTKASLVLLGFGAVALIFLLIAPIRF